MKPSFKVIICDLAGKRLAVEDWSNTSTIPDDQKLEMINAFLIKAENIVSAILIAKSKLKLKTPVVGIDRNPDPIQVLPSAYN